MNCSVGATIFGGPSMMAQLPVEVLGEVLKQLGVIDWLSCARVNRCWRREALGQMQMRGWRDYAVLRRTKHMICASCGWRRARIRMSTHERECLECRSLPMRQLWTETRVMEVFKLKRWEVRRRPCVVLPNPYNSLSHMRLYRLFDVVPTPTPTPHTQKYDATAQPDKKESNENVAVSGMRAPNGRSAGLG